MLILIIIVIFYYRFHLSIPGLKGLISGTKKKQIEALDIEKAKEAKLRADRPVALEV